MQRIGMKYILNVLLSTHHSRESRGSVGVSLHISDTSSRSRKTVNLFLVLHLRFFAFFAFIAFLITRFLLNEIYFTLKIRILFNENFLLVDYVWDSDLVTAVSHRQVVDLKLHPLPSTMPSLQTKRLRKRAWTMGCVIIEKQGQAF